MGKLFSSISAVLTMSVCSIMSGCNSTEKPKDDYDTTKLSFLVGTYTETYEEHVKKTKPFISKGIYALSFDTKSHSFNTEKLLASTTNPSFGVFDNDNQRYYTVNEGTEGQITGFNLSHSDLTLSQINQASAQGSFPCYIALSPDNSLLAVANYESGTVAIYAIEQSTGSVGELLQTIKHTGSSANVQRQQSPHAHWVQWTQDGKRLYVVDLGIDKVMMYEQASDWAVGKEALALQPGAGSRHMVFHPELNVSYVLNELNNTIVVADINPDGMLTESQQISMLPDTYRGANQGGHIALSQDGRFLYASNRGHNSIVVYQIAKQGELSHLQTISTGGQWPRFFLLSDDQAYLFVANQHTHNIVPFARSANGTLKQINQAHVLPEPVFMQELN